MTVYYGDDSAFKQLVDDLLSAYSTLQADGAKPPRAVIEDDQESSLLVRLFDDGKVLISRSDLMICHFCHEEVKPKDLNQHHIKPKSDGGTETAPAHKKCHISYHSEQGHFKEWGAPRKQNDGMNERL